MYSEIVKINQHNIFVYKKTIIDQNITIKGIIKIYKDLLV